MLSRDQNKRWCYVSHKELPASWPFYSRISKPWCIFFFLLIFLSSQPSLMHLRGICVESVWLPWMRWLNYWQWGLVTRSGWSTQHTDFISDLSREAHNLKHYESSFLTKDVIKNAFIIIFSYICFVWQIKRKEYKSAVAATSRHLTQKLCYHV